MAKKNKTVTPPPVYAPFSRKTVDYFHAALRPNIWLTVAEGGKRAGKNVINLVLWATIIDSHPDRLHLAAGFTQTTALTNIKDCDGFGLDAYFTGRSRFGRYENNTALYINDSQGREKIIIFVGGGTAGDYRRIKGYTLGSVYVTEANECHLSFIREVFKRTETSACRKIIFDLNPAPPSHTFYKDLLDNYVAVDDAMRVTHLAEGVVYEHFTIYDNLSVDNAKLKRVLATYNPQSLWYQTDVLGKRASSANIIYTAFGDNFLKPYSVLLAELKKDRDARLVVGVDIGGTDATVATLTAILSNGVVLILDGFYHKQGQAEGMTHAAYASLIADKIVEWSNLSRKRLEVFSDSADKLFRQALQQALRGRGTNITVNPSYKRDGVLARIRCTEALQASKRFYLSDSLTKWIEAFRNASWDSKAYENGDWVRLDNGSYPVDCLDSFEYTISPWLAQLMKGCGS